MMDYLGVSGTYGWDSDLNAYRAISYAELQRANSAQLAATQNQCGIPSLSNLNAMNSYRPPVHVPSGWQDWYASGDELH